MADEKKNVEGEGTEVRIPITEELTAKIDEAVAKGLEDLKKAQKEFRFHGSSTSKRKLDKADKAAQVAEFTKSVISSPDSQESRAKAFEYHNIRAKAINGGTDANGGFLVPEVFETEIYATFDAYNEIIADADVQDFNRPGKVFNLNELDTRVDVYWNVGENYAGTGSTPTYSEPQIGIGNMIGGVDITEDFMEDTEANIMQNLSSQFGEEVAKTLQAQLISGTETVSGVYSPGLFTDTSGYNQVEIAATASGYTGIAASDIEDAYFEALAIDHFQDVNQDGKFYMHPSTLQNLRKNIRSSSSDRDYLSVFDPAQMTLLGRPVVMSNQIPTPTTTTSNPFVLYGNLSRHLKIRRKRGMTMKVNTSGTSLSGRNLNYQLGRELVVTARIGYQRVLTEGVTVLVT